jgi:hypothetical protein
MSESVADGNKQFGTMRPEESSMGVGRQLQATETGEREDTKATNENHRELSGKRIVVLGGSSDIGLAVAQQGVVQGATAIIGSSNGTERQS